MQIVGWADWTAATGPWGPLAYTYDALGNRTTATSSLGTTTYRYQRGRLLATTGATTRSLSYDDLGRVASDDWGTYTYTAFDMVAQATPTSGPAVTYRYDGDQRRVATIVDGVTRLAVHGLGGELLAEYQDLDGATTSVLREYVYAGGRLVAALAAPTAFAKLAPGAAATAQPLTVRLSWGVSASAAGYAWCVSATPSCPEGGWTAVGLTNTAIATSLSPGSTYWWQVRATVPGGTLEADDGTWWALTTRAAFTDDPLEAGVPIKAAHVTELRAAINQLRLGAGLGVASWTDPDLGPGTLARAVHLTELHAALDAVYAALGSTPPTWDAIVAGETWIQAAHLAAVRAAIAAAPTSPPVSPPAPTPQIEYLHLDALGSLRAVTDSNGQILRRHDYLPFGEEWQPPAVATDTRLFTGHERDAETGMDYFGARYYRAGEGRFTTVDPGHVGGDVFDPQSWNAYAYARNNPLRYVDPDALAYRVVVEGGASPVWYLGDRQFEWMIAHPELNPGISFNNGVITAGGKAVGSYQHFDDSDAMIGLAGDLAACGLRREGKEMAAWAASGAIGGVVSGALPGGVAAGGAAAGADVTDLAVVTAKGARNANYATKLTAKEFQSNLLANGYRVVRQGVSSNGPFTVLSKGEKTYTIYTATSTGGPAAEAFMGGRAVSKIRLGGF